MDAHEGDPDWEGVHFHRHDDGTGHLAIDLDPRKDKPWWRQRTLYRMARWEITVAACCAASLITGRLTGNAGVLESFMLLAIILLVFAAIAKAVSAYRIGFRCGMEALTLAMGQRSPKIAAELVMRSGELWDPPPAAVAHTLEIERLERDINKPPQ